MNLYTEMIQNKHSSEAGVDRRNDRLKQIAYLFRACNFNRIVLSLWGDRSTQPAAARPR